MPNHPQQGRADEADRRALLELLEKEAVMLGLPPHLVEKYVATQLRVRRLRPANRRQGGV